MSANLTEAQYEAKGIVEEDLRHERESAAYQARVRGYKPPPDSDLEHDYLKDIGESPRDWRTRL